MPEFAGAHLLGYFADKAVDLVCWIRAMNLHFWKGNQGVAEYVICVFSMHHLALHRTPLAALKLVLQIAIM